MAKFEEQSAAYQEWLCCDRQIGFHNLRMGAKVGGQGLAEGQPPGQAQLSLNRTSSMTYDVLRCQLLQSNYGLPCPTLC